MGASEVPVLIAGGGAAGSMLLLELARRGVQARCIDRLPGPAPTSRAITVHARTAEIFERIDQRLIDRCMARALPSKGYVLHFVDDLGNRREVRPGLDFTALPGRYPRLYVHGQHDTEQLLRDYTREVHGCGVEWGTELVDVRHAQQGAVATLRDAAGREEQVHARYLVACDGKNSRVRRTLQLVQDESDYKGSVMQNLDGFLHDFPDTDEYVHYCAGRDHFVMVVKLPGGHHRLLLSDRGEAARGDRPPAEAFQGILDRHFDGVRIGEVLWHSKWESWIRLSHTYRERDVLLAGDSAHVHSTTGGQGMNCCLQDAWNLGWKLAMVLGGQARESLLDSYEAERKPIAEQVIWAASALHEIFMGHGQSVESRTARLSDPQFLSQVIGRCSGISYTYHDYLGVRPSVVSPGGGPRIGDRAPDADLADGATLFALTRTPGFSLLVVPDEKGGYGEAAGAARALAARYAASVACWALPATASLAAAYGSGREPRLYLVRPDGYVGYACTAGELPLMAAHLGHLLHA